MKALRILMIAPTPFFADRGCHTQIYEEIRHLQKRGHRIILCTYHHGRNATGVLIRRIPFIPWYRKLEAGPTYHKFYADLLLLLESLLVCAQFDPDIIHGHLHEGCAIGWVVAKVMKKPLLFDLQGSLTGELIQHKFIPPKGLIFRFYLWAERLIDNLPDVLITQSSAMAEQAIVDFGVPRQQVFLSMDGVDTEVFRPGIPAEELRGALGLPKDKSVVVYLGLLHPYQGVDCLIQAIPKVLEQYPQAHFLIMGYPNVEHYKAMAERLGVSYAVTFTGKIDYADAPRYLALGDIAVAPKIAPTEADGKIYNYMAMGLPTVAFDRPLSKEILKDLGVYAKLGDADSLAEALVYILKEEGLRKEISKKLREKAVREHSWDAVASRIEKAYEFAISKRR